MDAASTPTARPQHPSHYPARASPAAPSAAPGQPKRHRGTPTTAGHTKLKGDAQQGSARGGASEAANVTGNVVRAALRTFASAGSSTAPPHHDRPRESEKCLKRVVVVAQQGPRLGREQHGGRLVLTYSWGNPTGPPCDMPAEQSPHQSAEQQLSTDTSLARAGVDRSCHPRHRRSVPFSPPCRPSVARHGYRPTLPAAEPTANHYGGLGGQDVWERGWSGLDTPAVVAGAPVCRARRHQHTES